MAFALTILFIVATIISPEQFGKEWANYHALIYLAAITALASLPTLSTYTYWKTSVQTFLLLGLFVAIAMSHLTHGWLGGVIEGWRAFLPSAAVFIFIAVNVTTIRRLKIVALAAVASCLFISVEALCGYYAGFQGEMFLFRSEIYSPQDEVIGQLVRVRGAGFLSDPNDLAQILLIALPLVFIAWRRGRVVYNSFVVLVPGALLLWTTYLTHSRGGLIALAAVALMAARKKLGTAPSAALAAMFVFGMLALDFTGGRGISAADGSDRLEAWANGLEMFKSAPLFGVGFNNFTESYEITAHNSFVLCLAELGIFGSTLWMALLVTTTTNLNRMIGAKRERPRGRFFNLLHLFEAGYINASRAFGRTPLLSEGFDMKYVAVSEARPASIGTEMTAVGMRVEPGHSPRVPQRWLVAIRLALVSFMATSWFLSRSYTITMCLVVGLASAGIALQGDDSKPQDHTRWIVPTIAIEIFLIIVIYCLVRLRH